MRTTQIKCRARLASRLPPRLRRCLTTLPEDASTGETPQRLAKEASLPSLSGLSPTVSKSVAAWSVPIAGREISWGTVSDTKRSSCVSSSASLLREDLVTPGHRAESKLGSRLYIIQIFAGTQ